MSSQRRSIFMILSFLAVSAILGGLTGSGSETVKAASKAVSDEAVTASINSFTKIYSVVDDNFAERVDPGKGIYKGAIPGMLRTLDPHSNFFDPKEFASLKEEQHGKYYGVGMQIGPQPRTGKVMVIAPFGGTPAYKAGLRPGDVLLEVNDKRVDNLSVSDVADLLRGPKGTKVQIVASREGMSKPMTFNVVRDEIPRNSVDQAFFLKPGIAYLRVLQFTETTSEEMEKELKRLGEANIKGLVLDLRENPGGLLNEGVAVAGHWLEKGQVVVSHKGRAYPEKPYMAHGSTYGMAYPIVVLVNRYSASAAEIVAGALQDHDRAWVLGDTTFGKGLVQTVFQMSDNTGMALTTQHYYTPSGRLIQRDYSGISFLDYYYGKHGETKDPMDVKQTDLGRVVYGGGGITPDQKYVAPKVNKFELDVLRKNAFFEFTSHYFGGKDAKLPEGWQPTEEVLNEFHDFLMKQGVTFSEADWTANHDWVRQGLKTEMYITAFSLEDSQRAKAQDDPEVALAVEAMPKAQDLLNRARAKSEQQRAHL